MRVVQVYPRELKFAHNYRTESMYNNRESHNNIRGHTNKYDEILRDSSI